MGRVHCAQQHQAGDRGWGEQLVALGWHWGEEDRTLVSDGRGPPGKDGRLNSHI